MLDLLNDTSLNYCAMFAHKRLCTNLYNLGFIFLSIDPGTNSMCSRYGHMVAKLLDVVCNCNHCCSISMKK